MQTFDQWLTTHVFDESLFNDMLGKTADFIEKVIQKAEQGVEYLKNHAKTWGRKGRDTAISGIEAGTDAAIDNVKFAVNNPVQASKNIAMAVPKAMWFTFKKMRQRYGLAQAIGIMAVCVAAHAAFPPLIAMPASSVIGAAPGAAIAETWHQIKTSHSLLRQGVQGVAHLLHLDSGRETLTPERIKELGHEAYEELQDTIQKAAVG